MADVRPTKLQNDGNGYGSLREFADGDTVPVALGGTGAPTAAGARASLGLGSAAVRSALGSTGALYSRDSILGSVSQSSGVPTGAVIDRGSNANGEFVRFADGTQICAGVSSTALVCSVATGGGFQSGGVAALYFPAAFSAAPSVSPVPAFREGATARAWLSMNPPSASVVTLISHGFVDRAEVMPGYIAFGRWY